MRTLAGSNACAGRLDQILKSHPLPHKLHSPGDLSKGEAFVTIVKNAVRISDADVEAWHSARTRTRDFLTGGLFPILHCTPDRAIIVVTASTDAALISRLVFG